MLLAVSFALVGCKTIYSDMYSSRRSRYTPPPPKPAAKVEPVPNLDQAPPTVAPAPDAFSMPPPVMGDPALPADPGAGAMLPPAIPGL